MNRKLRRAKVRKKAILEMIKMGGLDDSVVDFFDKLMENGCPESAIWLTLIQIATPDKAEEKQDSKNAENGEVFVMDKPLLH